MPGPTYAEALATRTVSSWMAFLLAELAAYGSSISGWSDGAPQRAFLEGEARALSFETTLRSQLASTASIQKCIAAGPTWVDAVMTFFDLDNTAGGKGRIPASKAVWTIDVEITAALGALTINGANAPSIQFQSTTGVIFQCTQVAGVDIQVSTSYKGTIQVTARNAGTTGNVTPGAITKLIAGPAGLSVDLGGTQTQTSVARNAEGDAEYIARGIARWGREGAGWTTPAWDYFIPLYGNNGATGGSLNVTRWYVDETNPDGPGTVHVYLGNSTGPATAPEVAAVDAGLNGLAVKPVGAVDVNVDPATEHALIINITITTDGSNASVETDCQSAIETLIAAFPIGPATLEVDLVSAVARGSTLASATIATGATSKVISLDLPGFSSVEQATTVDIFGGVDLLLGEVFTAVVTVTVLP